PTSISALSLHDALPIFHFSGSFLTRTLRASMLKYSALCPLGANQRLFGSNQRERKSRSASQAMWLGRYQWASASGTWPRTSRRRSEEHTSELQSLAYLV